MVPLICSALMYVCCVGCLWHERRGLTSILQIELLAEILEELGEKHVRYGVSPDMYPIMGVCLLKALKDILPIGVMDAATIEAWKVVYGALSGDMIRCYPTKGKR